MPKQDALSDREIEQIINATETDFEKFMIVTLIFTGMRVDEFANMKKYWVDFEKELVNVPKQDGDWRPKTKAGARAIPIIEPRLKYEIEKYFRKNLDVDKDRTTIWRAVKKVAARTSINHKVYPHAFRSTFATMLIYKGISEGTLCSVMGWSDIKTAQSYFKASGKKAIEELKRKW